MGCQLNKGPWKPLEGSRVQEESEVFKPSVEWVCTCAISGLEVLTWQRQLLYPLFHNRLASLDKTSCSCNKWPLTLRGKWRAEPCASWAGVWSLHCSGLHILHSEQLEQHCSVSLCLICPGGQSSELVGLKQTGMGCSSKVLLSWTRVTLGLTVKFKQEFWAKEKPNQFIV